MIFYGRRSSRIKDGRISNVTCPSCEENTSMNYSIFGKYAHIYWIPTFPMGRENIIECNNCKQTFKVKELSEQIKSKFNLEKQDAKTPIWNFAGLAIIACLIFSVMYFIKQDKIDAENYIESPQFGDVYTIKGSESGSISTMKVVEVSKDSVYVVYNNYEIEGYSISELDEAENYETEDLYGFSNEELKAMFAKKEISDVKRK
jgi:uncharacterized Zn finger protein